MPGGDAMNESNQPEGSNPEQSTLAGFDLIGRRLLERPMWFLIVVLLGLVMLPVSVWMDLKNLSNESLLRQATDLNSMISDIRTYYSRNVVGRVLANHGQSKPGKDQPASEQK
jgi:hypothetical protein